MSEEEEEEEGKVKGDFRIARLPFFQLSSSHIYIRLARVYLFDLLLSFDQLVDIYVYTRHSSSNRVLLCYSGTAKRQAGYVNHKAQPIVPRAGSSVLLIYAATLPSSTRYIYVLIPSPLLYLLS